MLTNVRLVVGGHASSSVCGHVRQKLKREDIPAKRHLCFYIYRAYLLSWGIEFAGKLCLSFIMWHVC